MASLNLKRCALLLLLLPAWSLQAQNGLPQDVPLQGKVLNSITYRVGKDSLKSDLTVVERKQFDKQGRLLFESYQDPREVGSPKITKHVYKADQEIVYECTCKDIEPFVQSFTIRDREELKTHVAMATPQGPTHWVKIKQLDKKGRVTETAQYSRNGYLLGYSRFEYNSRAQIILKTNYSEDSVELYKEKSTYDSNWNLAERIGYRQSKQVNRSTFVYDDKHKLLEEKYSENNKIIRHVRYSEKQTDSMLYQYMTDLQRDSTTLIKTLRFDSQNRETARMEYEQGELKRSTITTYDDQGRIETVTKYRVNTIELEERRYTYDQRNNWVTLHVKQIQVQYLRGERLPLVLETRYLREIGYY